MQHGTSSTPPTPRVAGQGAPLTPPPPPGLIVVDALSTLPPGEDAAAELCDRAAAALSASGHNGPATLAVLFFTPHHAPQLAQIERTIAGVIAPRHLIGCSASSVLGGALELERTPALSLLVMVAPGVRVRTYSTADLPPGVTGSADLSGPGQDQDLERVVAATGIAADHRATILLADPHTTLIDQLLHALNSACAATRKRTDDETEPTRWRAPIVGGLASAANRPGGNTLLIDGRIVTSGCVGASLAGAIRADCLVSPGCRPIGPNLVVTGAQGQFIRTLGGRPALTVLEEIIESLDQPRRTALGGGLLLGLVANEYKDHFGRADYLMRNVVGVIKQDRAIAIDERARVGQTVRFHSRDADTAHQDLAMLLDAQALHETPAGVLVFSCVGRGTRLFPQPHHDAQAFQRAFLQDQPAEVKAKAGTAINVRPTLPLAGMFAAGEIGPMGSQAALHNQSLSALLLRRP